MQIYERPDALKGKVAIVTGAGRGIGRAVAIGYARAGAAVCCASRTAAQIEEVASQISKEGGKAIAVPTDQGNLGAVENMVETTVKAFGGLDILFVNAANENTTYGPIEETDPKAWQETIRVNLIGAYYCARAAIPHLKQRGAGKIIFVGSNAGHIGFGYRTDYCCSKAGLWMFTQTLAREVWQHNISVNELQPGRVVTERLVRHTGQVANRPMEWSKRPEDVVPLALFLATLPDKGPSANTYPLNRRFEPLNLYKKTKEA
jgi:3-oxoacyl-[acyl-carrier protein] reductase